MIDNFLTFPAGSILITKRPKRRKLKTSCKPKVFAVTYFFEIKRNDMLQKVKVVMKMLHKRDLMVNETKVLEVIQREEGTNTPIYSVSWNIGGGREAASSAESIESARRSVRQASGFGEDAKITVTQDYVNNPD